MEKWVEFRFSAFVLATVSIDVPVFESKLHNLQEIAMNPIEVFSHINELLPNILIADEHWFELSP